MYAEIKSHTAARMAAAFISAMHCGGSLCAHCSQEDEKTYEAKPGMGAPQTH
jgi:hypothetical protein